MTREHLTHFAFAGALVVCLRQMETSETPWGWGVFGVVVAALWVRLMMGGYRRTAALMASIRAELTNPEHWTAPQRADGESLDDPARLRGVWGGVRGPK